MSLNDKLSDNHERKNENGRYSFLHKLKLFNYFSKKSNYRARKLVRDEMFDVVCDVDNYKTFLPFCTKSTILEQIHEDEDSKEWTAALEIGFPPVVENYTSIVVSNRPLLVQAYCKDGKLFEYLETTWIFRNVPSGDPRSCIVDFSVQFKFKSPFYSYLATFFFNRLVQDMETAFIDEAKRRYGRMNAPIFEMDIDETVTEEFE